MERAAHGPARAPSALVRPARTAEALDAFDSRIEVLLDGRETGGLFALLLQTTPPGAGPPLHRHSREDETFFVLDGRFEFLIDGVRHVVEPGTTVHAPRGTAHTFRNLSDRPARMLVQTAPSGFEGFFREAAALFRAGPPDRRTAADLLARHGMDLLGPPLGATPRA